MSKRRRLLFESQLSPASLAIETKTTPKRQVKRMMGMTLTRTTPSSKLPNVFIRQQNGITYQRVKETTYNPSANLGSQMTKLQQEP